MGRPRKYLTEEDKREGARQRAKAWREAIKLDPVAYKAYRKRHTEARNRQRAVHRTARPGPLVGCVLWAAAPSEGRDILQAVTAATGRMDDRDEAIAEAVLLVLEGATVADAVKTAARTVRRGASFGRAALQLESCDWL